MKISFYYVEPDYINYLKKVEIEKRGFTTVPNVEYANKNKFVYGVILKINSVDYYVPITSYTKSQKDNILIKIDDHKKLVPVASMRFNYMIPVPKRCLISVDFNSSQFTEKEKIMLRKEYKACLLVISKAQKKAQATYDRVISGKDDILIRNSCDFKLLEEACIKY